MHPQQDSQGWYCPNCSNRALNIGDSLCYKCGANFATVVDAGGRRGGSSVPFSGEYPDFCPVCNAFLQNPGAVNFEPSTRRFICAKCNFAVSKPAPKPGSKAPGGNNAVTASLALSNLYQDSETQQRRMVTTAVVVFVFAAIFAGFSGNRYMANEIDKAQAKRNLNEKEQELRQAQMQASSAQAELQRQNAIQAQQEQNQIQRSSVPQESQAPQVDPCEDSRAQIGSLEVQFQSALIDYDKETQLMGVSSNSAARQVSTTADALIQGYQGLLSSNCSSQGIQQKIASIHIQKAVVTNDYLKRMLGVHQSP